MLAAVEASQAGLATSGHGPRPCGGRDGRLASRPPTQRPTSSSAAAPSRTTGPSLDSRTRVADFQRVGSPTRTSRKCPRLVPSRGFDSPFGLASSRFDFATCAAASALFTICLSCFLVQAALSWLLSHTHTHNHDPLSSVERTHSRHATMKPRHDDRPAVIGRKRRCRARLRLRLRLRWVVGWVLLVGAQSRTRARVE